MNGSGLTYFARTESVEETKAIAASLAPYLHDGDNIALIGGLGAGKTQFVQGLAAGMGITDNIVSPTFNLVINYEGESKVLNHFDLYRLEDPSQLEDIDYYSQIDSDTDGVSCIEWADRFPDHMPCDYLEIRICTDDGRRMIRARSFGSRSRQLLFVWANDAKSGLSKSAGATESFKRIELAGAAGTD